MHCVLCIGQFPKEINFGRSLYGLLERALEGDVSRGAKANRKGFTTNVVNESFVFTTFLICDFLLITIMKGRNRDMWRKENDYRGEVKKSRTTEIVLDGWGSAQKRTSIESSTLSLLTITNATMKMETLLKKYISSTLMFVI